MNILTPKLLWQNTRTRKCGVILVLSKKSELSSSRVTIGVQVDVVCQRLRMVMPLNIIWCENLHSILASGCP